MGHKQSSNCEAEKFALFIRFQSNSDVIGDNFEWVSSIELQQNVWFQIFNDFLRDISVVNVKDDRTVYIASEVLHRDVLESFDFAGHINGQEVANRFFVLLVENIICESQIFLFQV